MENSETITNLISIKESIKNQIITPGIHWRERLDLYEKVRMINEQIDQLKRAE